MANPNTKALKTIIKIKKSYLLLDLCLSLSWVAFGLFFLFADSSSHWSACIWIVTGLLSLISYFFEKNKGYLSIDHEWLKQHHILFPKKINLHEVIEIAKKSSGYVLKTKDTKLRIFTHNIEKGSLKGLREILERLTISIT